jgi:hypothetical protein
VSEDPNIPRPDEEGTEGGPAEPPPDAAPEPDQGQEIAEDE